LFDLRNDEDDVLAGGHWQQDFADRVLGVKRALNPALQADVVEQAALPPDSEQGNLIVGSPVHARIGRRAGQPQAVVAVRGGACRLRRAALSGSHVDGPGGDRQRTWIAGEASTGRGDTAVDHEQLPLSRLTSRFGSATIGGRLDVWNRAGREWNRGR